MYGTFCLPKFVFLVNVGKWSVHTLTVIPYHLRYKQGPFHMGYNFYPHLQLVLGGLWVLTLKNGLLSY